MKKIIEHISENLTLKNEVWYAADQEILSYPENANENFQKIEENSFWFEHRNNCITEVIKKFAKKKILFDVGGGNGYVSFGLKKNGVNSILVEPGINGILNAKQRGLKNLICSSFQKASFKNNSIPNIGVFDVIEHIENDVDFLKDLNQSLEIEGRLFITVPAFKFLWSNEDISSGHYRRYTIKQLKEKLKIANFEVEYATYFFSVLPFPIFLLRTIPSLFSKPTGIDYEKETKRHQPNKKISILDKIWSKEIETINKNKKIPFGGSCLIVAKKVI